MNAASLTEIIRSSQNEEFRNRALQIVGVESIDEMSAVLTDSLRRIVLGATVDADAAKATDDDEKAAGEEDGAAAAENDELFGDGEWFEETTELPSASELQYADDGTPLF